MPRNDEDAFFGYMKFAFIIFRGLSSLIYCYLNLFMGGLGRRSSSSRKSSHTWSSCWVSRDAQTQRLGRMRSSSSYFVHSCGQPLKKYGVSALFQCSNNDAWSMGNLVLIKTGEGRFWRRIPGEINGWFGEPSLLVVAEWMFVRHKCSPKDWIERHLLDIVCIVGIVLHQVV